MHVSKLLSARLVEIFTSQQRKSQKDIFLYLMQNLKTFNFVTKHYSMALIITLFFTVLQNKLNKQNRSSFPALLDPLCACCLSIRAQVKCGQCGNYCRTNQPSPATHSSSNRPQVHFAFENKEITWLVGMMVLKARKLPNQHLH